MINTYSVANSTTKKATSVVTRIFIILLYKMLSKRLNRSQIKTVLTTIISLTKLSSLLIPNG
jgi:hypothetical protein